MSDNHDVACDRDTLLESFAAELTSAAYAVALRHGMRCSWLEVELGLWRALAATVERWAPERPTNGSPDEFKVWQEDLLVDLTENAFHIAVKHGIKGALLEVEVGLYRAFRLVIRRREVLMKYRSPVRIGSALVLGFCLGLTGCARAPSAAPAAAPIQVTVSYPVEREVTDYADFTARTVAVDSVEVRAHVWGYIDKVNFREGALVKKGDVLFELDPRPYQALLSQAQAKVAQDEAQLKYDEAEHQRNLRLLASRAVSQTDLDKSAAARGVDLANIAADKAVVASRQLDLEYTKVTAPVSGRVSRYVVTVGNLIQSGDQNGGTLLTTIVSVDPMYAYFDVDERTVQRVGQLIREGKDESASDSAWPVTLGLATDDAFPHQGTINFVDNQVNPKTGTLRVRGVFPNKNQSLFAGFFARVRVPSVRPKRPCWSATAPSTTTKARRSSMSSTRRTRWSPVPSEPGCSTTACARSKTD